MLIMLMMELLCSGSTHCQSTSQSSEEVGSGRKKGEKVAQARARAREGAVLPYLSPKKKITRCPSPHW